MPQHFLLSAAARTLSLASVARMSDEEAWQAFKLIRWSDTQGEPVCPECGCLDVYAYKTRKLSAAKVARTNSRSRRGRSSPAASCRSATTFWQSPSSSNGAKGHSALQLSRDLIANTRRPSCWPQTPRSRGRWRSGAKASGERRNRRRLFRRPRQARQPERGSR